MTAPERILMTLHRALTCHTVQTCLGGNALSLDSMAMILVTCNLHRCTASNADSKARTDNGV